MTVEEGKLFPLFNYSTLKVSLHKNTQSLVVALDRPHDQNRINREMLFELETLFSWVTQHMEIQSILLTSTSPHFGDGLDTQELLKMDQEKVRKFLVRLQRLIYSFCHLPQTVVVDLKKGAAGASVELSIGADLRISHQDAEIHFDHLMKGLVPCCGGIALLGLLVPKSFAKNWVLSATPIKTPELLSSGLLYQTYDQEREEGNYHPSFWPLLQKIKDQGPIQRIQSKRAFLEGIIRDIPSVLQWETGIGHAGLLTEDWKEFLMAQEDQRAPLFTDPRSLAQLLKKWEKEGALNSENAPPQDWS